MAERIDIVAPEDGQEGTMAVLKSWLKQVGDTVAEHEPVAELETDKVAVEVPSPAAGVIAELIGQLDQEVEPGTVLARLDPLGAGAPKAAPKTAKSASKKDEPKLTTAAGETREKRLSPAVRRLIEDHSLDPAVIPGTGRDGRLTRADVDSFLIARSGGESTAEAGVDSRLIPLDSMRRRIAAHMTESVATAPHVTALFEADMSAIIADRASKKSKFAKRNVNLTFTAYFLRASAEAMRSVPQVNSRLRDDAVEIFADVNIGVGTALEDKGLIAPVIRKVQDLDLFGVAEQLQDVTARAKAGKLSQDDVRGGTFSISNHGVSGSLLAAPIIINQPQSAILGVGKLEKRVVVADLDGEDRMVIRPMAYVTLTIDHRVLDGFQTNAWLTRFVDVIENWE